MSKTGLSFRRHEHSGRDSGVAFNHIQPVTPQDLSGDTASPETISPKQSCVWSRSGALAIPFKSDAADNPIVDLSQYVLWRLSAETREDWRNGREDERRFTADVLRGKGPDLGHRRKR